MLSILPFSRLALLVWLAAPLIAGCGGQERQTVQSVPLFDSRGDADQWSVIAGKAMVMGINGQTYEAQSTFNDLIDWTSEQTETELMAYTTVRASDCRVPAAANGDSDDIKFQVCEVEVLNGTLEGTTGFVNGGAFEKWNP